MTAAKWIESAVRDAAEKGQQRERDHLIRKAAQKPARWVCQIDHFGGDDEMFGGWERELRNMDGLVRVQVSANVKPIDAIARLEEILEWIRACPQIADIDEARAEDRLHDPLPSIDNDDSDDDSEVPF